MLKLKILNLNFTCHKWPGRSLKKNITNDREMLPISKAMSKLTGGLSDVYLTQSELNNDGSYTVCCKHV